MILDLNNYIFLMSLFFMFFFSLFSLVLCGQLLCFFKDEDDFYDQKAASPPISIFQAKVEVAEDYTKRKNVFR